MPTWPRSAEVVILLGVTSIGALACRGGRVDPAPVVPPRAPAMNVLPHPAAIAGTEGPFVVEAGIRVVDTTRDPAVARVARALADILGRAAGARVEVLPADHPGRPVTLSLDSGITHEEGYRLSVAPEAVMLRARTAHGLWNGVQTVRQLLPVALDGPLDAATAARPGRVELPAVSIDDEPRFRYRGIHLDVGRHVLSVEFIEKFIDQIARYKFNRFHWRLTDDEGWRIQIEKYPRLTQLGASRAKARDPDAPVRLDPKDQGGAYTQAEIRRILAHAEARFVTVIPEISLPGHARAALAAHPELRCTPAPLDPGTVGIGIEQIYCPKEETFTFLRDVFGEVLALFPSRAIHIGGELVPMTRWQDSPVAQAVVQREGLNAPHALYGYFLRRIETFLNAHGRRLVGWDGILEGGLTPAATVMIGRAWEGGVLAVSRGHDVIMAPASHCNFSLYQVPQADQANEPLARDGYLPLAQVYGYEPIPPGLEPSAVRHVLGAQGSLSTEYLKTPAQVEYMAFPRALALAEVLWSPVSTRDYRDFRRRLDLVLRRLDAHGVGYRRPRLDE